MFVICFLICSGIELGHPEFRPGQASFLRDVTSYYQNNTGDANGHGMYTCGDLTSPLRGPFNNFAYIQKQATLFVQRRKC